MNGAACRPILYGGIEMLFIELNREWFENEFENNQDKYEYADEPYSRFVDSLFEELQTSERGFEQRMVKIQYPDGSQSMIADEATKYADDDLIIYDFEGHIWKHRYVVGMHHKNMQGLELLNTLLIKLKEHPSYMEVNQNLVLLGEVSDEPRCMTCG